MEEIKVRILDDWDCHSNGMILHDGEGGVDKVHLIIIGDINSYEDMNDLITSLQLLQMRIAHKAKCRCCGK